MSAQGKIGMPGKRALAWLLAAGLLAGCLSLAMAGPPAGAGAAGRLAPGG